MADDSFILNGHKREDQIARVTQIINQPCLGGLRESGLFGRSD
jgi:hypothetical protein